MAESVTHETLRAGQAAMERRFDRFETHFGEVTNKLFDKADEATKMAHENSLAIGEIGGRLGAIIDARDGHLDRLSAVETSVRTLHDNDTARMAERGVWAALARSPFIAWLAAAGAVLWAAILKYGEKAI